MHLQTWENTYRDRKDEVDIVYNNISHPILINAGTNDTVQVFRIKGTMEFLIYTENVRLPYAGVEAVELDPRQSMHEDLGDVFFQGSQADEVLGRRWEEKTAIRNAKILAQYLPY